MRSERRKLRSFWVKGMSELRCPTGTSDLIVLFGHVVEADGGFQHQQHVEAVLADVLDHAGDLLALNDRLMDGLAQLLNEFAQTGCHWYLQGLRPARGDQARGAAWDFSTLLLSALWGKCEQRTNRKNCDPAITAATIITK